VQTTTRETSSYMRDAFRTYTTGENNLPVTYSWPLFRSPTVNSSLKLRRYIPVLRYKFPPNRDCACSYSSSPSLSLPAIYSFRNFRWLFLILFRRLRRCFALSFLSLTRFLFQCRLLLHFIAKLVVVYAINRPLSKTTSLFLPLCLSLALTLHC
jgi:hypothetical protein